MVEDEKKSQNILGPLIAVPLIIIIGIVLSPILIWMGMCHVISGIYLKYRFRRKWAAKKKWVLFVTSESPHWKEYIEENILPDIADHTVTLNWSERSAWKNKRPLEEKVMKRFTGDREYCPIAIVVPPKGKVRTVKFYQAFKDHKHGKPHLLERRISELQELVAQFRLSCT
jgi:hypothetical protein